MVADSRVEAPLGADFIDWWFAPWPPAPASDAEQAEQGAPGLPALRDRYRWWCQQAGCPADLPASFDPAWQPLCGADGAVLQATARLYAGLIAAREHDAALLAMLPPDDRKWCASLAATQPLPHCGRAVYEAGDSADVRGLAELAQHLRHGFPGLWPRLQCLLPAPLAGRVQALLELMAPHDELTPRQSGRVQRCWFMCAARAAAAIPSSV
ncbi:hrpD-like protein [Janthinobacterium agaricidamnosum NBRC 102515 = DSM 9628]|uniref:HrpD-like protein n=2 Tax=Janthinobacterium agaricidamnosum TaxID=55508 RepID=W0V4Y0_9BURK|nr:hrpD-like protein [Janthinobacterium agaricidamnosum NBRC 102515 = DSM 9628]